MTIARWLGGSALVAILAWLIVDAVLHTKHSEKVAAALARHDIGLATPDEERRMTAQIGQWLAIAGVKSKFAVDQPPRRGQLNVYFTNPGAADATGVGYGNAAFDPTIDAIYIDRFFVDRSPYQAICAASAEATVLGCRENMPSQQAMLAFVFFHELGHRQLHGVGSSGFASRPGDPKLRRMENEADRFSLNQLKRAYATGHPVVADPDNSLADALGFGSEGDPKIAAGYRVWVDLFGALSVSTMLNGFLPAPFSPFYHDLAHPSLFDRTDGLLDVVLADEGLPESAKDQFRFFRAILAQEEQIPGVPFVEVTVPQPIAKVTFTDGALAALTMPHGVVYTADLDGLQPNAPDEAPKVIAARAGSSGLPVRGALDADTIDLLWGSGGPQMFAVGSDGAWRIASNSVQAAAFPIRTNDCFRWWTSELPSDVGVAGLCPNGQQQLAVASGDKLLGTVSVAALEQAVRQRTGDPKASLELDKSGDRQPAVTVTGRQVFIPIESNASGSTRYWGVLTLNLPNLAIQAITPLALPGDLAEQQPARAVFTAQDADGRPFSLAVGGGGGLKSLYWGVWHLSQVSPPVSLTQRPFLLATSLQSLSLTTISDFDPYLVSAQSAGAGWALVNMSGEGVFLVDLRSKALKLLYGYGGTAFRAVPSGHGKIALFVLGGGKIFVFSLP